MIYFHISVTIDLKPYDDKYTIWHIVRFKFICKGW